MLQPFARHGAPRRAKAGAFAYACYLFHSEITGEDAVSIDGEHRNSRSPLISTNRAGRVMTEASLPYRYNRKPSIGIPSRPMIPDTLRTFPHDLLSIGNFEVSQIRDVDPAARF